MHIIHVMDGWLDGGKDGMGGDGRNAIDAMDDHGCRHAGMYLYDCTWLHMVAHGYGAHIPYLFHRCSQQFHHLKRS
jgi:hypothetical protein